MASNLESSDDISTNTPRPIRFVPFTSSVEVPFWVRYSQLKLETIKLDESPLTLNATYDVTGGNSGSILQIQETGLQLVNQDGIQNQMPSFSRSHSNKVVVNGTLRGYNTMESFTKVDKNLLLREIWQELLEHSKEVPQTFVLLTFVDLKKHSVIYWFGFPAPMCKTSPLVATPKNVGTITDCAVGSWKEFAKLIHEYRHGDSSNVIDSSSPSTLPPFFAATKIRLVALTTAYPEELGVSRLGDAEFNSSHVIFGFIDPSSYPSSSEPEEALSFGWPLRNLLAFLSLKCHLGGRAVSIMSLKSRMPNTTTDTNDYEQFWEEQGLALSKHSNIWDIVVPEPESYNYATTARAAGDGSSDALYKVVGWELNARDKPGPRSVNLRPLLDETHLAIQAADLNLKLMKWRMIPSLQIEKLQSTRVLLLGAGTLGCSVARTLLGWGVRDFTFVDCGNVSYSNPVRQNLFTLDDCHYQHGVGRPKAEAAANALKSIAADVKSEGIRLSIPMPGHTDQTPEMLLESVTTLDELVKSTNVIFLLTDTRESRWLPTVMAAAHDKILINAALGLDSWLVMRHGGGIVTEGEGDDQAPGTTRLGCYFCNDIVAPENSTKNRTLDQQCTVTRPGLAPIASSMAVELLVSLLHHPRQQRAPAPIQKSTDYAPGSDGNDGGLSSSTHSSPLGRIPHQIRGSLVSYTMMNPTVPAFKYCTGCAHSVIQSYKQDMMKLVSEACASTDGSYLEDLSGLTDFRAEAADKLAEMEVDWDIDDDDNDDENNGGMM